MRIDTLSRYKYSYVQAPSTHRWKPVPLSKKMRNQERTWGTDGRQSWIRDGINTAAVARLWQIYRLALSELGPLLRWSRSFRSIPADTKALINMQSSAVSYLVQLSFGGHFRRNIQGYCRIISRLAVRNKQHLEYHEYMRGVRFWTTWRQHVGVCKISITAWLNHPLIQFRAFE